MLRQFINGIIKENPILILMIGLCPALACSSTAFDGLGMGIAVIFVLTSSNVLISFLRKAIPNDIRIPLFIIVIATFVTVTDYTIKAYFPTLSESLGVFIPLIVVNCVILARAEVLAYRKDILCSLFDGLGMGVGFALVLVVVGMLREFFGMGTIFGSKELIQNPCIFLILPPGAFLIFGLLISLIKYIEHKTGKPTEKNFCVSCGVHNICYRGTEK